MKFGKTLDTLMVPEWRHQYMNYNVTRIFFANSYTCYWFFNLIAQELKNLILNAVDKAPNRSSANNAYYKDFELLFFATCKVELTKVNDFFVYKQAEAHRKLATLNYQLTLTARHRTLQDPRGSVTSRASNSSRSHQDNRKMPPLKKLGLAMSEFYLR